MKAIPHRDPVCGGRIFFSLLLLCSLQSAFARQTPRIVAGPASGGALTAKPGSLTTVAVRVTNHGPGSCVLSGELTLPAGWRLLVRERSFRLSADSSDVRLMTIALPADVKAGKYPLRYAVKRIDLPGTPFETDLPVTVLQSIRMQLLAEDAPQFTIGGKSYTAAFRLTNTGNAPAHFRLTGRSSEGFSVVVDSGMILLPPLEGKEIRVSVHTLPLASKVDHTLELAAVAVEDSSVFVRASSVVAVVPPPGSRESEYERLPVTVRVRAVGENGKLGFQGEVQGGGSLNKEKSDYVEFLARFPETQTRSVLGLRDEYRVTYRSRNIDLMAGDLNYVLTPLTEIGRYASGAGARIRTGKFGVGGFYNLTRWSTPSQKEAAAYVSFSPTSGSSASVNYLHRKDQISADVATLRGIFSPLSGTSMDLEAGVSDANGKRDAAYTMRIDGSRHIVSYDVRYVHAGAQYGGSYRDVNFFSGSVSVRPNPLLHFDGYAQMEDRNLSADTALMFVPRTRMYQVGGGYSDLATLSLRHTSQDDQATIPKYRRSENVAELRLGHSFRSVAAFATVTAGSVGDELQGGNYPSQRLALYMGVYPSVHVNLSTNVEYSVDRNLYANEQQRRLSGSVMAWLFFAQATRAQLSLYASRVTASTVQTYATFEGFVEHIFPFGHIASLRIRNNVITPSSLGHEFAYSAEYAVPLAVPLKRNSSVGTLTGRITDENGRGVPNVLIEAGGSAALTDESGSYTLSSLKSGPAYLAVDKASIGLDKTVIAAFPMEVLVEGGTEVRKDLRITRSASLSVTLALFGRTEREFQDTSAAIVELGGQPGIIVEITNGTTMFRRATDNHGVSSFNDLVPGTWKIRIAGGNIPSLSSISPESLKVDIAPGTHGDVRFEIRPKRRVIRILDEGEILMPTPVPGSGPGKNSANYAMRSAVRPEPQRSESLRTDISPGPPRDPRIGNKPKPQIIKILAEPDVFLPTSDPGPVIDSATYAMQPAVGPELQPASPAPGPEKDSLSHEVRPAARTDPQLLMRLVRKQDDPGRPYVVEVARWTSRRKAERIAAALTVVYHREFVTEPVTDSSSRPRYQVSVGGFEGRDEAWGFCRKLHKGWRLASRMVELFSLLPS